MIRFFSCLLASSILSLASLAALAAEPDEKLLARAEKLLREVPLIDGHNDLPWEYRERVKNHLEQLDLRADTNTFERRMHTDIARLKKGHVGAQFWSVYVPVTLEGGKAVTATLEQIDVVHRFTARYSDVFELARTSEDIRRIHRTGKIASLIGVEGGHSIDNSLAVLRMMYDLGARYMTVTHSKNTAWADSATDDPKSGGLSPFGVEVVREMNRLGMLVDLSHVSPATMHDALDVSVAPVIFSHSSARGLTDHPRNVPDDVLKRLPKEGGVVMVTFVTSFVSNEIIEHDAEKDAVEARFKSLYQGQPDRITAELEKWDRSHTRPKATLEQVADHIDHIRRIAGIDHVGIGSDFDGITNTPTGLDGVDAFPRLLAELLRRGYSDDDIRKIAGLNVLRVFRQVEQIAAKLQRERGASDVRIEECDVQAPAK